MSESVPATSDTVKQRFGNSPRELSGTKVMLGIFALAIAASASVWVYSYYHAKPFQPLQVAIYRAFPKSYPQVQGGQRRMHRNTPKTLRITLQVNFDPEPRDADMQVEAVVARLEELARKYIHFPSYEIFEIHLVQRVPEHKSKTRTITREIVKSADARMK